MSRISSINKSLVLLERMAERELDVCLWFNRACRYPGVRAGFAIVSWLGDGKFWYALILLLPLLYGAAGLEAAVTMIVNGLAGTLIYKVIKEKTGRLRPCNANRTIAAGTAPLDFYSFPSGHTLHAVSFTVIAVSHFPHLAGLLAPFATLVALSRVILGLHYPTDVIMGALIGLALAVAGIHF